ncbi:hypothetical protein Bca4012_010667 [Brassica carinata]|uniref:Uncharacterized protein n=1 Tax=Brassica carinata TaxID=52824 RepID=A0A8X7S3Y7_BRACI|nr:hypothetical protein Bca52824_035583 [Brassica carinata]
MVNRSSSHGGAAPEETDEKADISGKGRSRTIPAASPVTLSDAPVYIQSSPLLTSQDGTEKTTMVAEKIRSRVIEKKQKQQRLQEWWQAVIGGGFIRVTLNAAMIDPEG